MNTKSALLNLFIEKNPNWVSEFSIKYRMKKYNSSAIDNTLSELVSANRIEKKIDERKVSGKPISYYRILEREKYPIKEFIQIGDVNVPRLLSDTKLTFLPEIFNEQFEKLAEYTTSLEDRFAKILQKEQQKYWSNIIGVFGVLVSVLALVIVGLPKINVDPSLPFWDIVVLNLAQLLPIAIVLLAFVGLLKLIIK